MLAQQARGAAALAAVMMLGVVLLFSTEAPDKSPLIFTIAAFLLSFAILLGLSQMFRDASRAYSAPPGRRHRRPSGEEPAEPEQPEGPGEGHGPPRFDPQRFRWRRRADFATVICAAGGGSFFVISVLLALFERVEW